MRSVEEWVATHDDQAIPERVKLRIWRRENGRCYLTGKKIMVGDTYEFEHKKSVGLGGEHRESNIFLALTAPHKLKTKAEAASRKKADRTAKKHVGIAKPSSRLSHPTLKRQFDGTVVPRGARS